MVIATSTMFVVLALMLAVVVGGIILQIFLSKRESKWFGLILPAIALSYALLMVLNIAALPGMSGGAMFLRSIVIFLIGNIPTFVLLAIYFGCREKRKLREQLEKMNKQDLD